MTTSKAIKFSLLFPAFYLFAFILILQYRKPVENPLEKLFFAIIICIVIWIIGLFLGLFISAIRQIPQKEFYNYLFGQILILLIAQGFWLYDYFQDLSHEKKYGNIEHNRSFLFLDRNGNVYEHSNPLYVKIGFNRLEAEFLNNNDFRLTDFFSFHKDSTNGTYTDTLRILYFSYLTKEDKELFSKVEVFEGKATLKMFNEVILTNQEFIQARKENWKIKKQASEELLETLKELKKAAENDSSTN